MSTLRSSFVSTRLIPAVALTLTLVGCGAEPSDDKPSHVSDAGTVRRDAGKDARAADPDTEDDTGAASSSTTAHADAGRARDASATTVPPAKTPDAAAPRDAGGPVAPVSDAGSVSGVPPDELETLRQVCVDEINMYRATLMLAPLKRATPEQELCSDRGSQKDGIAKVAHGSAGAGNPCSNGKYGSFPYFGAQDTCPGWPVGARGAATIADAMKGCLKSMWAEGIPAEGVDACIAEYRKGNIDCFEMHGHYINMSSTTSKAVSCGFYNMGNNTYWMNQDFQ